MPVEAFLIVFTLLTIIGLYKKRWVSVLITALVMASLLIFRLGIQG